MANNIGIFVCGCRGLVADVIDPARMQEELAKLKKSVGARVVHPWLCGDEGREVIRDTISRCGLDCVVLAGCPGAVHEGLFTGLAVEAGLSAEMVLRLDIREGCAYPHRENPAEAFRKAANLIRMWTARARLAEPFSPVVLPGNREVAVIGGGLAGMTAALDLAEAGIRVTLIERESYLGGNVARLDKIFPRLCDARCGLTYLYNRIRETGKVKIMTLAGVRALEGSAGRYTVNVAVTPRYVREGLCNGCGNCVEACPVEVADEYNYGLGKRKAVYAPYPLDPVGSYVIDRRFCPPGCEACSRACPAGAVDLTQEPVEYSLRFGSAVVATGWKPYPVEKVERLGYGVFPDVITSLQMERLTAEDGPTGGKLLCPGSGREAGRVVFVQCAGSRDVGHQAWCSAVCCTASIKQALIIKEKNPRCRVYIFYTDIRTPGEYEELYLRAQRAGVVFVRANPAEVGAGSSGGLTITAEDTLMGRVFRTGADLIVLAAGMTPCGMEEIRGEEARGAPRREVSRRYGLVSAGGFHVGHRQCFPMESADRGIYFAGCCQEPMDMGAAAKSALAASGMVIKTAAPEVEVSPLVPMVDKSGCDKCKRCMEECPYGVFRLDGEGYPVPDRLFCRACHVCVGSCPRQCIVHQGFGIRQQIAMVGARIKETAPGEPLVIAFLCENDAYPAVLEAGRRGMVYPANIHVIPVRCAGSVNMALIKDGISAGIDGFLLAGCRSGECHHISGSDRAAGRLENIGDTLRDMMIDQDRVKFLRLGIGEAEVFAGEAGAFVQRLRQLGANPFKNAVKV
ncbi:MAG: FAD-dependent oxidoreductase [Peptococcaceae bacterium]|nr:FAD-dependent oxidoreductase [Peptococcaceae bacterium]